MVVKENGEGLCVMVVKETVTESEISVLSSGCSRVYFKL